MRRVMATVAALVAAAVLGGPAAAQSSVGQNDIQRLQDVLFDAGSEVRLLRAKDPQLANQLQSDLDELRDETIYLRVKLRKEGSVSRSEYADVRDRIDDVRRRARGDTAYRTTPPPSPVEREPARGSQGSSRIPVGTEIDVRLQNSLSSDTAQPEDRFLATTVLDLRLGEDLLIPAGSEVRGVVSAVDEAGRLDRKGSLTLSFDQITVNGRNHRMRGTVTQALESEGVKGEVGRIATGSAAGAIIGGILGGFKGAMAGILIGGGGVIAATPGKDVELPAGTILRVRLDSPPDVN